MFWSDLLVVYCYVACVAFEKRNCGTPLLASQQNDGKHLRGEPREL